ncbi:30S ribosomal protein S3 [Caldithrix abyssi]|uniref:Small ribosomal subunit protein uS3 n=1 Tax=Caldithrix abyssi DSM 13497 TaxID=880073 RepID=H1XVI4_CALAY|nr:30S ribosomal protein S3 [Caldithrix abyssi]APF17659.1 rpsC SSU ribosomal protein S3P [Caldithrix abyssi DSM 13497]EHO41742.1 ribosomal protein S3 [Caldithrix abyssi DSM 13497]
MGQKTNPIGLRLGIIKSWNSSWFDQKNYAEKLHEDLKIRNYIRKRLDKASVSKIEIERTAKRVTISIHTARPGIVIGKKGAEVDKLREELRSLTKKEIQININEIKKPELDAYLVAENIARQIEGKVSWRRAMKKAITAAMRLGAEGIKIMCSGRLGGAEMARTEMYKDGRIPLHTLRADVDYAQYDAVTTYGTIGIKVWIFHGEVIGKVL